MAYRNEYNFLQKIKAKIMKRFELFIYALF